MPPNQTRERILSAAGGLVLERGPDTVTVQAVAEASDVAVATVYNHFSTREVLLEAAFDALHDEVAEGFAARGPNDGSPAERLDQWVATLFADYERLDRVLTPVLALQRVRELDRTRAEVRRRVQGPLRDLLAEAGREGLLRYSSSEADVLAHALLQPETWRALSVDVGLTTTEAVDLISGALAAGLFLASPAGS